MKFVIKPRPLGTEVVEVFDNNGRFLATITPSNDGREIRVVSKYIVEENEPNPIAYAVIRFRHPGQAT